MTKTVKTISFNGSMLDDRPTGVGVYTYNIINNLSQLYADEGKHRTIVFSPTTSFLKSKANIRKISGLLKSSKYGKLAALLRFLWNLCSYPLLARRSHVHISPTTHANFFLNNQVITIHDLLSLRYENISFHQRLYFKMILPLFLRKARTVVAVSNSTKEDIVRLLNYPAHKVKVVYNGYDEQLYYPATTKSAEILSKYGVSDYLLAVGPTYPHKNFERLLTAYKNLPPSLRQKHRLLIAGGLNKYLLHLQAFVKSMNLESEVVFVGYVPRELMRSLYQEARALVFPSLYEGFGFPLLEAMACGCPVITSSCSSMPEVCGDAALYFNPENVDSMEQAIALVLTRGEIREALTRKGIARASEFSWKKTASELKIIIDEQLN